MKRQESNLGKGLGWGVSGIVKFNDKSTLGIFDLCVVVDVEQHSIIQIPNVIEEEVAFRVWIIVIQRNERQRTSLMRGLTSPNIHSIAEFLAERSYFNTHTELRISPPPHQSSGGDSVCVWFLEGLE